MASIISNPPDATMWKRAFDAKYHGKGKPFTREEWDQLLGETQVRYPYITFLLRPTPYARTNKLY
jgi:Sulfotransferase domain